MAKGETKLSELTPPQKLWESFFQENPIIDAADGKRAIEVFGREMNRYCEYIRGSNGIPAGFMVRGQGKDFTDRTAEWMEHWKLGGQAIQFHLDLANAFAYTNGFMKMEWHGKEESDRLMATYYRRRPSVKKMLLSYSNFGVSPEVLEKVHQCSHILEKESIHFVAAAYRPNSEIHHKVYFSQALDPSTFANVTGRIIALLDLFQIDPGSRNLFLKYHPRLAPPNQKATLFISFSFTELELSPSFKLDYQNVPLTALRDLAFQTNHAPSYFQDLCDSLRVDQLSYLGFRLHPDKGIGLKYYGDYSG